jgi:hypothetical protein
MSSKLFIIHGAPRLTQELKKKVGLVLAKSSQNGDLLKAALKTKSKSMGRLGFLKLHILQREFYGEEVPAVRFLIASARSATQALNKAKSRFRREK